MDVDWSGVLDDLDVAGHGRGAGPDGTDARLAVTAPEGATAAPSRGMRVVGVRLTVARVDAEERVDAGVSPATTGSSRAGPCESARADGSTMFSNGVVVLRPQAAGSAALTSVPGSPRSTCEGPVETFVVWHMRIDEGQHRQIDRAHGVWVRRS